MYIDLRRLDIGINSLKREIDISDSFFRKVVYDSKIQIKDKNPFKRRSLMKEDILKVSNDTDNSLISDDLEIRKEDKRSCINIRQDSVCMVIEFPFSDCNKEDINLYIRNIVTYSFGFSTTEIWAEAKKDLKKPYKKKLWHSFESRLYDVERINAEMKNGILSVIVPNRLDDFSVSDIKEIQIN